jgi:hypothetical protein
MRPQGSAPDPSVLVPAAGSTGSSCASSATEGIIATLVQAPDVFAVVARVSDLHPRTKGTERRKIFHDKADGLGRRGKATIAEPRPHLSCALP